MLPVEDPNGLAERGLRPLQASAEPAENVRRLRAAMARGEGYVGFVIASAGPVSQSESAVRPLVKEIADRGLALIEINPTPATAAVHRLTVELGTGYARTADVLDYKLADGGIAGNLDRLVAWAGETASEQPARHGFGVMQPDDQAIDALAGLVQAPTRAAGRLVRADHRPLRMPRRLHDAHARPAGPAPAMTPAHDRGSTRILPPQCRPDADRRRPADLRRPARQAARRLADAARRHRRRRELRSKPPAANCGRRSARPRRCCCARAPSGSPTTCRRRCARPTGRDAGSGQAQKWFALAFTGRDADIDIAAHDHEFDAWQWLAARRPARPHRAVQAPGLRSRAEGIRRSGDVRAYAPWSASLAALRLRNHRPMRVSRPFSQPCGCKPIAFSIMAMARCTWLCR